MRLWWVPFCTVRCQAIPLLFLVLASPTLAGQRSERRDSRPAARIVRSSAARRHFRAEHPCPGTGLVTGACAGYVIDHVIPLKRGGPDLPENMQWQTTAEGRAKDRIED